VITVVEEGALAPVNSVVGEGRQGPSRRVIIELLDSADGIAPGQAAVIYDGTRVVGSATIASTARVPA
jgi:tRNA-specific 2-thiouridylase